MPGQYDSDHQKPVQCICAGFLVLILLCLSGCGNVSERQRSAPIVDKSGEPERPPYSQLQTARIKAALYAQHDKWAGTPYRLGGLSRNGIDCSGFVYTTFRRQFDRNLPRTTASQARLGQPVARERIRPGDLLFFQTGRTLRHVGIYVEDNKFLHASTSEGVIFSSLDDPYWASSFWKAQRLTDLVADR